METKETKELMEEEKELAEEENSRQKNVIEAFDKWKAGKITKDEYSLIIYSEMYNLIKKIAKKYVYVETEDAVHSAFLAILLNIDKYNPRQTLISTFFTGRAKEAIRNNISNEKTQYYRRLEEKLNKTAQCYGYENCYDKKLTDIMLAHISGESVKSINALKMQNYTLISIEDNSGEDWISSGKSPEDVAIDEERKEIVRKAKMDLTPLETYLVDIMIENPRSPLCDFSEFMDDVSLEMANKAPSIRTILTCFNSIPELRKMYDAEMPHILSYNFFESKFISAKNKLYSNLSLRSYTKYDGSKSIIYVDENETADVLSALEAELI